METISSAIVENICSRGVKTILCSEELRDSNIIKKMQDDKRIHIISYQDARTVGYVGTGIAADGGKPVVIVCNEGDARSLAPAQTEAFYRQLPVMFLIIRRSVALNNTSPLNDISNYNYYITKTDSPIEVQRIMDSAFCQLLQQGKPVIQIFCELGDEDKALQNFQLQKRIDTVVDACGDNYYYVVSYDFFKSFKSKALNVYTMKNTESSIGYLSYYLGTLLSESGNGIAVITEDEFLLDINTLGSRHYPDNTCVIVMCKSKQDMCYRCADAFGMNIVVADIEQLVLQKRIFHRTVILLNGE